MKNLLVCQSCQVTVASSHFPKIDLNSCLSICGADNERNQMKWNSGSVCHFRLEEYCVVQAMGSTGYGSRFFFLKNLLVCQSCQVIVASSHFQKIDLNSFLSICGADHERNQMKWNSGSVCHFRLEKLKRNKLAAVFWLKCVNFLM